MARGFYIGAPIGLAQAQFLISGNVDYTSSSATTLPASRVLYKYADFTSYGSTTLVASRTLETSASLSNVSASTWNGLREVGGVTGLSSVANTTLAQTYLAGGGAKFAGISKSTFQDAIQIFLASSADSTFMPGRSTGTVLGIATVAVNEFEPSRIIVNGVEYDTSVHTTYDGSYIAGGGLSLNSDTVLVWEPSISLVGHLYITAENSAVFNSTKLSFTPLRRRPVSRVHASISNRSRIV